MTARDLAAEVQRQFGYPTQVTRRYLKILISKRQTWLEEGGKVRPRVKTELPDKLSFGFPPVKIKHEVDPVLWAIPLMLAIAAIAGGVLNLPALTGGSLLVLVGYALKEGGSAILSRMSKKLRSKESQPIQ